MPTFFFGVSLDSFFPPGGWRELSKCTPKKEVHMHNKYYVFTYGKWTLAPSGSGRVESILTRLLLPKEIELSRGRSVGKGNLW